MRTPPRLMPALITPFTDGGEIDAAAHTGNVAILAARGIEGFLVAGSTGEGPYLEPGERRLLTTGAREAAPGAFVLCGVAAETVRGGLNQAEEAAAGGADAILVVTPTTLIRGDDALVAGFYADMAARSPLPVFLYSVPRVTGYELPAPIAAGLNGHPNIAGMKDSGGQPVRVPMLLEGAADGFAVYSGSTPALSLALAAGARGGITASSNYAAPLAAAVIEASGDHARIAQAALTATAGAVERHGIGGVKAAAALTGLTAGPVRAPLRMPSPAAREEIAAALIAAGII